MTNTMADLRQECAARLREALHGREIDTLENDIEIPHMLGIAPIGTIPTDKVEEGTLLDPAHEFWTDYEEEVRTSGKAHRKVESAIRSLRKDDIFRMTYPYGEEADIVYCEVDEMAESGDALLTTECASCEETVEAPLSLELSNGYSDGGLYKLVVDVDCPHCGFERLLEEPMRRR